MAYTVDKGHSKESQLRIASVPTRWNRVYDAEVASSLDSTGYFMLSEDWVRFWLEGCLHCRRWVLSKGKAATYLIYRSTRASCAPNCVLRRQWIALTGCPSCCGFLHFVPNSLRNFDHSVFKKEGNERLVVLVLTDDMIIAGSSHAMLTGSRPSRALTRTQ
jgi:hypothetical protein